MNKNLFLLFAFCAISAQSFSMDDSNSDNVSGASKGRSGKFPTQAYRTETYADVPAWTRWKGHPLRVSTHVPGMHDVLGDTFTPCVDAACLALVAGGLGYGAYSQRGQIARGAKALASGTKSAAVATGSVLKSGALATKSAAVATGSVLKSGALATRSGLVAGAKATPKLAGTIFGAALYPAKQSLAHPTAAVTGAGVATALVAVWNARVSEPAAFRRGYQQGLQAGPVDSSQLSMHPESPFESNREGGKK